MAVRDLTEEDMEFFPNWIVEVSEEATKEEILEFKQKFDGWIVKLLEQTKDFYERIMLSSGVFYTRNDGSIYFHQVYGINRDEYMAGVFLAYYPEDKGEEFKIKADYILHLHLFSDKSLQQFMQKLNQDEDEDVGQGLTHFYFNRESDDFRKTVIAPAKAEDKRKSLIDKNSVFQVLESKVMKEDLELIEKYMQLLLRKMKISKESKELG